VDEKGKSPQGAHEAGTPGAGVFVFLENDTRRGSGVAAVGPERGLRAEFDPYLEMSAAGSFGPSEEIEGGLLV